ncbi:MAG: hypothetical protein QXK37_05075 [Candidatus Woesearchaeota archaeon]
MKKVTHNFFVTIIFFTIATLFSLAIVGCSGKTEADTTCFDGIQNQGETGIDCGGPCKACETCNDNIQNQGEEKVDCGGPCSPCDKCSDGIQNQGETGIDCGGPCKACETCNDNIQNQGETDIDCGGPCNPCSRPVETKKTEESYEISEEDKALLLSKLNGKVVTAFGRNIAPTALGVGEHYVYAFAIQNIRKDENTFRVNVSFANARDMKNNPIATNDLNFDDSYMRQWLGKNNFNKELVIEPGKHGVVPIILVVGDMYAAQRPTKAGQYSFKVVVQYKTQYNEWLPYAKDTFSVLVK